VIKKKANNCGSREDFDSKKGSRDLLFFSFTIAIKEKEQAIVNERKKRDQMRDR